MMAASTKEFVSTLNDLIETCRDAEQGFRKAAENVTRTDLQTLFNQYAQQRGEFASELQVEVSRIGGAPEKSGSVSGALHRGWIDIKQTFTGKDAHTILEECERGEDAAVRSYQDALAKDLPSDIRGIVERQYHNVQLAHGNIRSLRDRTGDYETSDTLNTRRTL
jgi:uncharacterized protein (TIGR02284 family)